MTSRARASVQSARVVILMSHGSTATVSTGCPAASNSSTVPASPGTIRLPSRTRARELRRKASGFRASQSPSPPAMRSATLPSPRKTCSATRATAMAAPAFSAAATTRLARSGVANGCTTSCWTRSGAVDALNSRRKVSIRVEPPAMTTTLEATLARTCPTQSSGTPTRTRPATDCTTSMARSSRVRPPRTSNAFGPSPSRSPRPAARISASTD